MALTLNDLTEDVRALMLEEIEMDLANASIYMSPRLSPVGQEDWPHLLKEAAASRNDDWLAAQLNSDRRLNNMEQRKNRNGVGYSMVQVPITAAETLAEGEFNRFYIRAVCRKAISSGMANVIVYRAKHVMNARSASQAKIDALVGAEALLNDLRTNIGVDTALGLPAGPNSGLSVHL